MSLISIGLSGLTSSSAALNTIGNNMANVDTAGYSRQQVMTTASGQTAIGGAGYIGTGTTISDVRRIYNSYLDTQLQTTTALDGDTSAFLGQVGSTDTLLSDSSSGISSTLKTFFTQLQAISTTATDAGARSQFLTTAGALASRFNSMSSQLTSQNTNINSQLTSLAGQVNQLSSSIAQLNQQIKVASAGGSTPNTLLDSRNEAVRQLNTLVGAKVTTGADGSYDVYIGTGQALVTGNTSNTLTAGPSASDPSQYNLSVNYGSSSSDVTSVVTGGSIGGLIRYRNDVLNPAVNELGRVALTVSDQVNSQLNQGIDLNGNFGSSLFSSINSISAVSQRSIAQTGNSAGSGNLDVTISDTSKLTTNDYKVTFTSATAYSVTRSDGTNMGSFDLSTTPPPVIDGFTLKLNGGGLAAGDSFKVTPTRNASSGISTIMTDPSTLAAAAPLTATAGASNKGSSTISAQPSLTSKLDIYNPTTSADLRNGITNSTPLKLTFGAASGGSQTYTLLDAKGNTISTGSIVPGQANTLKLTVPMVDAAGAPITSGGVQESFTFQMTLSGSPTAGDAYNVALTPPGSSDNRNASAAVGLQTAQTVGVNGSGTGMSLSDAYGKLVETVGAQASQAKNDSAATTAIVTQAKSARDSVSGVNLDEETANLVKYQQYYTASSQIIKTAQDTFTTLINAL
ncbi:flagellar hook-associated protein FlgK [Pseudomonas sp. NA-150]|uniref:flagellar hook-associated protein FlgK n=1 Tax=Pseudomonas sp. NA-150 TaxID=3367525 RepID=UPI0037C5760F